MPAPPATPATPGHVHVPVLDGIRGLAIALVMFHHFLHGVPRGDGTADKLMFAAASRGWVGVDLFFVLSGFLITGILLRTRKREGYFRTFYARRVLRIFPIYYFVLFVFYVVFPRSGVPGLEAYVEQSAPDQVWFWTYLTNIRLAMRGEWYDQHIPNVFWSLAIEEQFYMVWPLVVLLLRPAALGRLCLAMAAVALALRVGLALQGTSWVSSFVLTPTRMDALALGSWLAVRAKDQGLASLRKPAWIALALAAVPAALLETHRPPGWEGHPLQALRFTHAAVAFAAVLVLAVTAPPGTLMDRIFSGQALRLLGKYSYALYLWHGPADTWVRSLRDPAGAQMMAASRLPDVAVHVGLATAASIVLAVASWHGIEKWFLRLKDRFR